MISMEISDCIGMVLLVMVKNFIEWLGRVGKHWIWILLPMLRQLCDEAQQMPCHFCIHNHWPNTQELWGHLVQNYCTILTLMVKGMVMVILILIVRHQYQLEEPQILLVFLAFEHHQNCNPIPIASTICKRFQQHTRWWLMVVNTTIVQCHCYF